MLTQTLSDFLNLERAVLDQSHLAILYVCTPRARRQSRQAQMENNILDELECLGELPFASGEPGPIVIDTDAEIDKEIEDLGCLDTVDDQVSDGGSKPRRQ